MSTADRFQRYFSDFGAKYGFQDMYTGGFFPFPTLEEHWAYWSRMVWVNRYQDAPKPVYQTLRDLLVDKDHFILTTNVDHCFQKAGFDKKRLFYTQGDYGLFQCSAPCCQETWDNRDAIQAMLAQQKDLAIPTDLLPRCPRCGRPLTMNLRSDDTFVQDEGWYQAADRYAAFLRRHERGRVLYLELGVGYNTPVIIKYPFWRMTAANPRAVYACLNLGQAAAPREIQKQSICIDGNIGAVLAGLGENTSQSASVEFVRFQRTNYARGRLQFFIKKALLFLIFTSTWRRAAAGPPAPGAAGGGAPSRTGSPAGTFP